MTRNATLRAILMVLLVLAFLLGVWPTLYVYRDVHVRGQGTVTVRFHRVTGASCPALQC